MKAWTNLTCMYLVTFGLFAYAFIQPVVFPSEFTNESKINYLSLALGFVSIYFDVKQYTRIKNHYRHLRLNITDPKCVDCEK